MKKNLLLLIFVSIFFLDILKAEVKTFKVSYDPDYAPFSYYENDKPVGLLIDIWQLWAKQNNYKVEFVRTNLWEEALNLVKEEKVDFFLGTQAYKKWMKGSNNFYNRKTSLFVLKDNNFELDKDKAYNIGVISQEYEKFMQKEFPNSKVITYKDYPTAFEDFISKKLDFLYEDKIAIEFYALRNNFFHDLKSINYLTSISKVQAIAKDEKLIKIFNKGLENIKQKDLYKIESKWIINKPDRYYKNNTTLNLTKEEKEFLKNTTLHLSISKSWKPFTFINDLNQPAGISHEIWELISKKADIKYDYQVYSKFTNQLEAIKNKTADVIYSTGKTALREQYSVFTNPYVKFPISIATLKDENFIENIDYLKDKTIAVGKNFTAHKLLKLNYPKLNFLLVDSIKEGLDLVRAKKAFAFLDMKPILSYNINKYKFNDLKISGNSGLTFELAIMIRDDYKLLQNILDKTINSLEPKEIKTIVDKWENIQFEREENYKTIIIIIAIAFLVLLILSYKNKLSQKRNKKLQELVEERTLELKTLNENLENKIDLKTKELRRVNYLLDEAQKIAHLGSFQYHIKNDQLFWSDELYKIFGYYPEEVTPSINILLQCVFEEDRKIVESEIKIALHSDKKRSFEFRIKLKNGVIKYLQYTSKITKFDVNNQPLMMIGTILDLTKLKNLEIEKMEKDALLAQQTKMAAMGEMLENIAHQWRQPLSAISTASTGIQIQMEIYNEISEEFLLDNVKLINEHTQYLSKTIEDFRNFFIPNKLKVKFKITDTIEKTLYLITARVKQHNITIIKEIEDVEILSLENELIQVLLNILNNAIDALKSKESEEKLIFIKVTKSKKELKIEIQDNAGGIYSDIIDRIFEPYFTTKHKSQGTGIGLYMSMEIVKKHLNGNIQVNNTIYTYKRKNCTGANFIITLPLK